MAYLNETGLARFWNHILSKLSGKVDREEGKGLSTNDYTTEEKEKLAGVEALIDTKISEYVITTEGNGAAYTATVPSIKSLTAGVSFIMIPHVVSSTTSPTLNVNSLGAKNIKRRLSSISTDVQNGYTATWLAVGKPFRLVYDGMQWIVEGLEKPVAADLYGNVSANKISEGTFTGAVTANASAQSPDTSLIRNSKLVSAEATPQNEGEIYWIYE